MTSITTDPICCDKPLITRYCPYCGKESSHSLYTLLAYVESRLASSRTRYENAKNWSADESKLKSRRDLINKWQTWAVSLAKVLDEGK